MCDPIVAHNYNLHVWISLLIIFGGLGFPIVFNYLKLLRHFIVNTFMIAIGQQKHYILSLIHIYKAASVAAPIVLNISGA